MSPRSQLLARALTDIPAIPRDAADRRVADELLDDIIEGRAKCVDLVHGEMSVGSLVYEVRGLSLIVHALRCDNVAIDCTALAVRRARELARANGCRKITFDTKRAGLVAKLAAQGLEIENVSLSLAV